MKVKRDLHHRYVFDDSLERIKTYLDANNNNYEKRDTIPSRDSLTFDNGFYVDCYAVFVDIRDSSDLTQVQQKSVNAKIYRSYISEIVAIMQSYDTCREINIIGDCVSGIFSCQSQDDVMSPLRAAADANSIVKCMNILFKKKGYSEIKIGIGIARGMALMVKAGYENSGLNDVIWMGDVVNKASNLCNVANKGRNEVIVIDKPTFDDLDDKMDGVNGDENIQDWFVMAQNDSTAFTSNIVKIYMENWYQMNQIMKINERYIR